MVALSAKHYPQYYLHDSSNSLIQLVKPPRLWSRRLPVAVACQRGSSGSSGTRRSSKSGGTTKGREELKQGKQEEMALSGSLGKLGKALKESLSPKQKGDWKDVVLMSLSFAVYVYMSQQIVCAYCVWVSMMKHPW